MPTKKKSLLTDRSSGVLLHISSLPGPHGIGDLGQSACDFIDFLAEAGQKYWQFLPLGPTGDVGSSPYMGLSVMAGNPLFISLELLMADGLLDESDCAEGVGFSEHQVCFSMVIEFKTRLLEKALVRFLDQGQHDDYTFFCNAESSWLDDYALFMAIHEQQNKMWCQWPEGLASRTPGALKEISELLHDRVQYFKFEQFCFFQQWQRLRAYAHKKNVQLIGDLPIYVSLDSVDVWANQSCFMLDKKSLLPTHVAGVPPDYFSETGQRWGNPLYQWKNGRTKNKKLYQWWRKRFKHLGQMVDAVRIDHFRGFESYWQIPAEEETAVKGRWVKGPGKQFFVDMGKEINDLPIVAEDLGIITDSVRKLREDLGFPGMKILQFAFDSDENNLYLPHNYESTDCVVYTGTHDNDTTVGWYLSENVSLESMERVRKYANSDGEKIHWDFIRLALSSTASTAITPLQDVLGFGADCRMNTPGTIKGNWQWRCAASFLDRETSHWLYNETLFYGRVPRKI